MKKAAKYIGFGVVMLLMTVAVLTFLAPRFGWSVDTVFSGSMEPRLKVGGMAITHPVEAEDIKVGDIITFYPPQSEKLTSHRIISVEGGSSLQFRTKGDANDDADPFVVPAQGVVGKVWLHIPYLGYAIQFVKTPLGFLLTLCLPGLIIIGMEIRNIWRVLTERKIKKEYRLGQANEG